MINGLKKLLFGEKFRIKVHQDFAPDMGIALGRLGLEITGTKWVSNDELELTGPWTPNVYGEEATLSLMCGLPVREATVY